LIAQALEEKFTTGYHGPAPANAVEAGEFMSSTLIITGSPSGTSRTARLGVLVGERLARLGTDSSLLDLRSLPAEDLLHARSDSPAIANAVELLAAARGIVIATPVYKAAYSGLLKTFLDLLPQFGLRGKVVLPLATGGTIAHVLSIDYALRPVLSSLDPLHIVAGLFLLDKQLAVQADDRVEIEGDASTKLDETLASFVASLKRAA
jgi:FMN reductase